MKPNQHHGTAIRPAIRPKIRPRMGTPRETAIILYAKWLHKPGRIDLIAHETLAAADWSRRDKALFTELVYGVMRWRGRIDWLISRLSQSSAERHTTAYAAVSIGIYQMLFLDRVPDHAAVDTAVSMARSAHGADVAGWVNAVLRRLGREHDKWREALPSERNFGKRLAVEFSHPEWLVERWMRRFSREDLITQLKWDNRRPKVMLRVNTLKATADEVLEDLVKFGIPARKSELDANFIVLDRSGATESLKPVAKGVAAIQDHAQGLVARVADPQPGERILDLCSAPGGKTGYMAELCPEATIIATDKSAERAKKVRNLVLRQGYKNVNVVDYTEQLGTRDLFDIVLIDAPCTGTGALARRPDLRWRLEPAEVRRMASVQLQLLHYAAERVAKGGRIVYSTCSLEPEENEQVVTSFLEQYHGFSEVAVTTALPDACLNASGRLALTGPEVEGDGVFVTVLQRSC